MIGMPGALNLSQAFSEMLAKLDQINASVRAIRLTVPPPREEAEPVTYILSSADPKTSLGLQIPTEFAITSLLISSDVSGRGNFHIGQVQYPINVPANIGLYIPFGMADRWMVRNARIRWVSPTNTSTWDVIVRGHPAYSNMQGAAQRV